ncbi:hypothetical protein K7472_10420 [Streptomyces sp. PTM05]|uniref:Uncharacterized protein n=1 Tax=Streptantibioticus parmotrematis TaxID=2873249 RepID=A0ABS7QRG0_9ACTN|nr:hypothetical protein [Streptantibioticus parmotrematis]MBY8885259.1 hypothetical protein [Streptantibioticus parmotrematis]
MTDVGGPGGAPAGGFPVATGHEPAGPPDARRRPQVEAAYAALLDIRRLVNADVPEPLRLPAPWEVRQAVRAVALTLEAHGVEPSALGPDGDPVVTGYLVSAAREGVVRVEWVGPRGSGAPHEAATALKRCAAVLEETGWTALEYRDARGRRHVEAEPPA